MTHPKLMTDLKAMTEAELLAKMRAHSASSRASFTRNFLEREDQEAAKCQRELLSRGVKVMR